MTAHRYEMTVRWTGNRGKGTEDYRGYSRDHEIAGPQKAVVVPGSSDPAFRGDATRYNPEEMLVGSLAACHMLWVLHLAATAGIVITEYVDAASGTMVEHPDGSGEFESVTLRPRVTITDAAREQEAIAIHLRAHDLCFIARSVKFPVRHEPQILTRAEASRQ